MKLRVFPYLSFIFSASLCATPWEQVSTPTHNSSSSIGSYANGCLDGAYPLPLEGTGYQVLRSRSLRYYGHPNTISFIESLALKANKELSTNLLIGDLSLPRGGRFSSGHSSHQTGLDIDIWLRLADQPLSYNELQLPKPMSVVDLKGYSILDHRWDDRHFKLIRYAAQSEGVARIFVHPVIKEQLCSQEEEGKDRSWLSKVRPWWGHHYHFHVRLSCPDSSRNCVDQAPPPAGDGCGYELASWKPKAVVPSKPSAKNVVAKPKREKVIPPQCQPLIRTN
ncbi:penicillin-insensitive murein endopeptidase [Vibrio sp. J1-1]|uniref:penicillin-insensitive murein endopeptidase n=1 Tax=Vibrio sp. J1-1 TaxID=2912251 RepID=UPI001F02F793|nr:penicillin-insensitive murein endopeptidase [Vibrio sp. J1-1]MBR9875194.1 penicillin-insensitive murein endopeptidase [Vibrionaceae bacterium]MCF7483938.1 penicillin-insensitive murein endopeptidase [Vibrio sp. J1-1]